MDIKAYIYHKKAEKYSDCQDCFGINTQSNRIAISDGMSQSIFPQWWAKILVDSYLEMGVIPEDISPLQKQWQQKLQDEIIKREEEAKSNPQRDPWRLKNSFAEKSGAGATLCGLSINDNEWVCECLGDSCLIAVNNDYSLTFYTSQEGEFGNHPDYFDSFTIGRGKRIKRAVNSDVRALIMVSDPFAELFKIHESDLNFIKERLTELEQLSDHNSFKELVEKWRDIFNMHNDDSTLVFIDRLNISGFTKVHIDDLSELCKNENDSAQISNCSEMISEKVCISRHIKEDDSRRKSGNEIQNITKDKAFKNFESACNELFPFYSGKKNKRRIKKWINKISSCAIKKYLNK